jgi:hypothetical protein
MLLTRGDKRASRSHAIFLLKEFIIHPKICGSQRNLQQFHNGFRLQGRLFHQSIILMEFIADDPLGLILLPGAYIAFVIWHRLYSDWD